MNICFEYLYRDAGNFKNWGRVVFSNRRELPLGEIEKRIRAGLIDGEFFVADELGVPDLHFENFDSELDHGWHEFFEVRETEEGVTDIGGRDVEEFGDTLSQRRERKSIEKFNRRVG